MLVTKDLYLYVYNETSNKMNPKIIIGSNNLIRFYVRIYYKGSYAHFVKTRSIDTLPSKIDCKFMKSL